MIGRGLTQRAIDLETWTFFPSSPLDTSSARRFNIWTQKLTADWADHKE